MSNTRLCEARLFQTAVLANELQSKAMDVPKETTGRAVAMARNRLTKEPHEHPPHTHVLLDQAQPKTSPKDASIEVSACSTLLVFFRQARQHAPHPRKSHVIVCGQDLDLKRFQRISAVMQAQLRLPQMEGDRRNLFAALRLGDRLGGVGLGTIWLPSAHDITHCGKQYRGVVLGDDAGVAMRELVAEMQLPLEDYAHPRRRSACTVEVTAVTSV